MDYAGGVVIREALGHVNKTSRTHEAACGIVGSISLDPVVAAAPVSVESDARLVRDSMLGALEPQ